MGIRPFKSLVDMACNAAGTEICAPPSAIARLVEQEA